MRKNILVYEDKSDFREALVQLINSSEDYYCVDAARNCSQVIQQVNKYKPEVVLMDIDMPEINGIEGVRLIRSIDKQVKIIMLTVFEDNKNVINAICAGASGYLLKKHCLDKLFESIEEVLMGGAPMSANIARMALDFIAEGGPVGTDQYNLTIREKEILGLLVNGNSYKMIAATLFISNETVKSHIRNIYEKLQVHNQSEAVAKALKNRLLK
jgi:DNA-binding NarL/FixJ family response regulator